MKNTFLIGGITLISAVSSQAALVYTTDFDIVYSNSGSGAFALGGATPDVAATEWFGASQNVTINPALAFNNATQGRYRGTGVWLDTSLPGWAAGTVTVQIDATAYSAGTDTSFTFEAFAANGVNLTDSGVSLDLHGGSVATPTNSGTASIASIDAGQSISGAGINTFTFNYNGTDQYIGLVFAQVNAGGGTDFGTTTLDNLTVNTIPEPSSTALLGLGGLALILRRRK